MWETHWAGQERGEEWPSGCSPLHPQLRSGERIKLIPLLCIACTSVVWGFALFFFFQGLSTWQVSGPPAGGGASPTGSPHFPAAFLFSPPASECVGQLRPVGSAVFCLRGTCPGAGFSPVMESSLPLRR